MYSEQLGQLAAEAKELEAKPDYQQARERALMGLPLLPSNSRPLRTLLCFNISNCGTRLTFDGVDWAPDREHPLRKNQSNFVTSVFSLTGQRRKAGFVSEWLTFDSLTEARRAADEAKKRRTGRQSWHID